MTRRLVHRAAAAIAARTAPTPPALSPRATDVLAAIADANTAAAAAHPAIEPGYWHLTVLVACHPDDLEFVNNTIALVREFGVHS